MTLILLKYLDFERIWNLFKVITSYGLSRILKKAVVFGMPPAISVEPTNLCNLSCPECPTGTKDLTRPAGNMSFADFRKIIDEVRTHAFYLQLYFQGEPFLNPGIFQMLDYARGSRIFTSISTNGLLIDENTASNIIDHPPDQLIFSIDGTNEASYASYRIKGSLHKAEKAIRMISEHKRLLGKKLPDIEFQMIVTKQNENQMKDAPAFAASLGADRIVFKSMQVYSPESAKKYLPENSLFSRYILVGDTFRIKKELKNKCFSLWKTTVITWDCRIVPCCFDKDASFQIGTLNGKSFASVWQSDKFNSFRTKILNNRHSIAMCTNCGEGMKTDLMKVRLS